MEIDLRRLEEELEFVDITESAKEKYINVYKSWKTCYNNQIMITNIKSITERTFIEVNESIFINGTETHKDISLRSTLFFSNCENVNILLHNKVNHVFIEKSKNITLKTMAGIIGGIDVLHSDNINFIVVNQDVFYMSFADVRIGNTYIDKSLSLNTLISTLHCHYINFVHMINNILEKSKYITNVSLFGGFYLMFFKNGDNGIFELQYVYQENNNKQNIGIIYPTTS